MLDVADLTSKIKDEARALGFDLVGVAPVTPSDHAQFLTRWLEAGHHGEMAYLARPDAVQRRLDPVTAWPSLKSAIVVTQNYFVNTNPDSQAIVARYAHGRDYHKVMKAKLLK